MDHVDADNECVDKRTEIEDHGEFRGSTLTNDDHDDELDT